MSRAPSRLLQLVLALWLGLGPLAAEGLAQLLHAPRCACCVPAQIERDCCASAETRAEQPARANARLVRKSCACALALPKSPDTASPAPRASETRVELRAQLEHAQRVQLRVCSDLSRAHELAPRARPPGAGADPGPAGHARECGAERAAALGVLTL